MVPAVTLDAVFDDLPDAVKRRIGRVCVERTLRRGQMLFRAGDPANGLYSVLSGRIRVSREAAGRVELLQFEAAGGILGEIPVFGGGAFPSTAGATEASRCARIPDLPTLRAIAKPGA